MQVNIHEAKTNSSRLLKQVENGEKVILARHGVPIAEIVPFRAKGFPFGLAQGNSLGGIQVLSIRVPQIRALEGLPEYGIQVVW